MRREETEAQRGSVISQDHTACGWKTGIGPLAMQHEGFTALLQKQGVAQGMVTMCAPRPVAPSEYAAGLHCEQS